MLMLEMEEIHTPPFVAFNVLFFLFAKQLDIYGYAF